MNVYMSFWSGGAKSSIQNLDIWKLSLALAKKHYNKVFLISDDSGCDLLGNLPFNKFINILNDIPHSLANIWCLGKIYAYKYACDLRQPFLHLDSDVFLWEPLPQKLLYSRIFAQSKDIKIFEKYHMSYFDFFKAKKLKYTLPNIWEELIINKKINFHPYNMGIFGGFDTESIKSYCEFAIEIAKNSKNQELWKIKEISSLAKSCMVEQGNLAIFCYINNIKVETLYEDLGDKKNKSYKKYTHLMLLKNNYKIKKSIKKRVSQNPYDLTVKNVPIERWHSVD